MQRLTEKQRNYINALMKRVDRIWQGRFTAEHVQKYRLQKDETQWLFTVEGASEFIAVLQHEIAAIHLSVNQADERRQQFEAERRLAEWERRGRIDTTLHNVGYGAARPQFLNSMLPKQKDFD